MTIAEIGAMGIRECECGQRIGRDLTGFPLLEGEQR